MFSPSPASENLPGWVLIFSSPTFCSPMCSVSVPRAGIASPSRSKRGREDVPAGRNRLGRLDDLLEHADPVVDVLELAILAGVVDVAAAWLRELRPLGGQDLDDDAVLERQRAVAAASDHQSPISSCSLSGCSAARWWHSLG